MASLSDGEELSLRHGVRCVADSGASVEDVLRVAAEQVGGDNIVSASRMNKAVVIFFKKVSFASKLIASGLWIKGVFVQVNPLSAPATRVTISNVPPFIKNETIERELSRFGKFAGPMRMIPLGCKTADLKHVLSFRRHISMFLTSSSHTLDVSFRVKHGESSFMVFASTESLRCFECGDIGHLRRACPHKDAGENADEEDNAKNERQENSETPNSESNGAQNSKASEEPGSQSNADAGEGTSEGGVKVGAGQAGKRESRTEDSSPQKEGSQRNDRMGRPEAKRTRSGKNGEKMSQSTERKKGRVEEGIASEGADVNIGTSGQDSEGVKTNVGNPEINGAASGANEEVDMTEEDIGNKKSDGIQEDDGELSDSSIMSDITASQAGEDMYSFEDINDYLDLTKGRAVNVLNSFPDGKKFLRSAKHYMKNIGLDILSSQKRFRLKKHCTTVRKSFKSP